MYFCIVNKNVLTYLLFAFGLFSLLLTGESALHSQKSNKQHNQVASEYANQYIISQHQLKAIATVKDASLTKADLPIALTGSLATNHFLNWEGYKASLSDLFQVKRFVPDKRKFISLLLYPYHYFW